MILFSLFEIYSNKLFQDYFSDRYVIHAIKHKSTISRNGQIQYSKF